MQPGPVGVAPSNFSNGQKDNDSAIRGRVYATGMPTRTSYKSGERCVTNVLGKVFDPLPVSTKNANRQNSRTKREFFHCRRISNSVQMAGNKVARRDFFEFWYIVRTPVHHERTPGVETAALGWVQR